MLCGQTWFGCGCSFVGHPLGNTMKEKSCKKHRGWEYSAVFGDQCLIQEMAKDFSNRLTSELSN